MTLIDQIIENTASPAPVPVVDATPSRPALRVGYMRGIARPVTDDSSVQAILEQTGLAWKTVALPVLAQGHHENRVIRGRKVLVRSDNGEPIEVVSQNFREHQNSDIISPIVEFIRRIDGRVKAGGYMAGLGRVFLVATLGQKVNTARDRQVDDVTELEVFVSGGHVPGTPLVVRAIGRRLVCSNGMSVPFGEGAVLGRVTHRQDIAGTLSDQRLREWLEYATHGFQLLTENMAQLQITPASRALQSAVIVEAVSGADILNEILGMPASAPRESLLEEILRRDEKERCNRATVDWLMNTPVSESLVLPRRIINTIDTQPGAAFTRGTLAHATNGVSNYVDNIRGRSASSAVEAAVIGDGDRLKNSVMTVANEWMYAAAKVGVAQ